MIEAQIFNNTLQPCLRKALVGRSVLFNEDFFKVLPYIKSKSIDIICSDLPYGTTNCKWDTPVDLPKMWTELNRIIKNNGVIICLLKLLLIKFWVHRI